MARNYFNGLEAICTEYIESNSQLRFCDYVRNVALYHDSERWAKLLVGESRELTEDEIDDIGRAAAEVKFIVICDDGEYKTQEMYQCDRYSEAFDFVHEHNVIDNDNTKRFEEFIDGTARITICYEGWCFFSDRDEEYYDIIKSLDY